MIFCFRYNKRANKDARKLAPITRVLDVLRRKIMETAMVILDNLNASCERYERLQGRFNEFCAQILHVKEHDDRLNHYTFEQGGNKLTVTFLDRHIEANFMFSLNDDESRSEERRVGKECRSRWSPYH